MSNMIDFEQHKPILLTRVSDANPMFATLEDSDGQKYIATSSARGLNFIPLFENGKQMIEYEKKYGDIKRRCAVSTAQAVGVAE